MEQIVKSMLASYLVFNSAGMSDLYIFQELKIYLARLLNHVMEQEELSEEDVFSKLLAWRMQDIIKLAKKNLKQGNVTQEQINGIVEVINMLRPTSEVFDQSWLEDLEALKDDPSAFTDFIEGLDL